MRVFGFMVLLLLHVDSGFGQNQNRTQGEQVEVTMQNGRKHKGELIVVTHSDIYCAPRNFEKDSSLVNLRIADISQITIVREVNPLHYIIGGALFGTTLATGALLTDDYFAELNFLVLPPAGALLGGGIGVALGADTKYRLGAMSPREVTASIKPLMQSARLRALPSTKNSSRSSPPTRKVSYPTHDRKPKPVKIPRFRLTMGGGMTYLKVAEDYGDLFIAYRFDHKKPAGNLALFGSSSGRSYPVIINGSPQITLKFDFRVKSNFIIGLGLWTRAWGEVQGRRTFARTYVDSWGFERTSYNAVEIEESHTLDSKFICAGYRHIPKQLVLNRFGFTIGLGMSINNYQSDIMYTFDPLQDNSGSLLGLIMYGGIDYFFAHNISLGFEGSMNKMMEVGFDQVEWTYDTEAFYLPSHNVDFSGYNWSLSLGVGF